jgi:hypothetical protein
VDVRVCVQASVPNIISIFRINMDKRQNLGGDFFDTPSLTPTHRTHTLAPGTTGRVVNARILMSLDRLEVLGSPGSERERRKKSRESVRFEEVLSPDQAEIWRKLNSRAVSPVLLVGVTLPDGYLLACHCSASCRPVAQWRAAMQDIRVLPPHLCALSGCVCLSGHRNSSPK